MSYQVLIQPPAFQEIENAYRWMCDYLSADAANQWYYDLQDAIASLQQFPYRCRRCTRSCHYWSGNSTTVGW